MSKGDDGVSIVMCCYNSAERLTKTLSYLRSQEFAYGILWELIIVDNASTDNTAEMALSLWSKDRPCPLRVISEPMPGQNYARRRGLVEANYSIVSFIDDDNWVCDKWIQRVYEVMSEHPDIGACGGIANPVFEIEMPSWFSRFQENYAVGPQSEQKGYVKMLYGAGLTVRKEAWRKLAENDFIPLASGRQGKALFGGDDTEICFALRLSGWGLWYEPSLKLWHYLSAPRLNWRYLRSFRRFVGRSIIWHDAYLNAFEGGAQSFMKCLRGSWQWRVLSALRNLFCCLPKLLLSFFALLEADAQVLYIETQMGRLSALLKYRSSYSRAIKTVKEAKWRAVNGKDRH